MQENQTETDGPRSLDPVVRRPSRVGWYAVKMKGGYKTQAWWSDRLQMWELRDGGFYPPDAIANWQEC